MTAVWVDRDDGSWAELPLTGFEREKNLQEVVFRSIGMLPLAEPRVVALAREVQLTPNGQRVDLLAVDTSGTVTLIEVKLSQNQEARKAVVAQVLSYAASLRGTAPEVVFDRLRVAGFQGKSVVEALSDEIEDTTAFELALAESLATGRFRLVLVLDSAPTELIRLIGYLEDISEGRLSIDLITVNAFRVDGRTIVVPQRVDPQHVGVPTMPQVLPVSPVVIDAGGSLFATATESAPVQSQAALNEMLEWARNLEDQKVASLITRQGVVRTVLTPRVPGNDTGLVSLWNDRGYPFLWFHGTVIEHLAPQAAKRIAICLGKEIGFRSALRWSDVTAEMRSEIVAAYHEAAGLK